MQNLGDIFMGVTPSPTRDYIGLEMVRSGKKNVYMPCCGRFGVVQTYLGHGGVSRRVLSSDIGIFSTIVGFLADPRHEIAEMGLEFHHGIPEPDENPLVIGSTAMLALKLGQLTRTNPTAYMENIKNEVLSRWDVYMAMMKERLEKMVTRLDGIKYDIQDMWEVLKQAAADKDGTLFVNAPTYDGGYDKMFDSKYLSWNEPDITQFTLGDRELLFKVLENAKCDCLVGLGSHSKDVPEEGWRRVVAVPLKPEQKKDEIIERADVIVTNMESPKTLAVTKVTEFGKPPWPVYCDEKITKKSKIAFVEITSMQADYYRDLFVHKLGAAGVSGAFCYAMLIDGRVAAVLGLNLDHIWTGMLVKVSRMDKDDKRMMQTQHASEVFGVVKTSEDGLKLKRLLILASSTGDFGRLLRGKSSHVNMSQCRGLRTTTFTKGPVEQARRGVSECVEREITAKGHRLVYRTDFREDETYDDALKQWFAEEDRRKKENKSDGRKGTRTRRRNRTVEGGSGRSKGAGHQRKGNAQADDGAADDNDRS